MLLGNEEGNLRYSGVYMEISKIAWAVSGIGFIIIIAGAWYLLSTPVVIDPPQKGTPTYINAEPDDIRY